MGDFTQIAEVAARQHGVVSRRQLARLGRGDEAVRVWVASGRLEIVTNRVLRVGGASPTALQAVMAAVLDAGEVAVASHATAAWLWRLPGFDIRALEVMVLRGDDTRAPRLAVLHRPRLLLPHHVTTIENIPVTSLARTIFDLAGDRTISMARLDRLLNTVLTRSPGMGPILHDTLPELARRGRPGIRIMRQLLKDHPAGEAVPASGLERRFEEILRNAGVPVPDRQVDVGGEEWIGRVDYCDRALGLLVEIDSVTYHSSLLDRRLDALRDEALLAAGWRAVLRIQEADIWHRPWNVIEQLRTARRDLARAAA